MTALHLMVDGYAATVPSAAHVGRFLADAIAMAKLKVIAGPYFFSLEKSQEAWVIVAESHVSVKWFPSGLVLVDLFSCKPFDAERVVSLTVERFGLEHWQHRTIQRMGVGNEVGT